MEKILYDYLEYGTEKCCELNKSIVKKRRNQWIDPLLRDYLGNEAIGLKPKAIKKRANRKYLLTKLYNSQVWKDFENDIKSGCSLTDTRKKYGIAPKQYNEMSKYFDVEILKTAIDNKWRSDRIDRMHKYSDNGKGKTRHGDISLELKAIILKRTNEVMDGTVDISRDQLYRSFPPYGRQKIRSVIIDLGIDINKLPNRGHQLYGERNSMFGKIPPEGAGRGIAGWVLLGSECFFFRSLLECVCYSKMYEEGKSFSLSVPKIKYSNGKSNRTYFPDFTIGKDVYEIKPQKLLDLPENIMKFKAANEWTKQNGYTFNVITDIQVGYNKSQAKDSLRRYFKEEKIWFFNEEHLRRFNANTKNSKRSHRTISTTKTD
jgi:hypothetical protein